MSKPTTIQQTGKQVKAAGCLAWALVLAGGGAVALGSMTQQQDGSAMLIAGCVVAGLGVATSLGARVARWWHHE